MKYLTFFTKEGGFWDKNSRHIYGLMSLVVGSLTIITFMSRGSSGSNKDDGIALKSTLAKSSIAVLPFADLSALKDQEYFGDGIAEEVINTLTKLTELRVAGRTSSFAFKDKGKTLEEIGRTLGVDHVLEGSIRKDGDNVRITAQLSNVIDGFQIWSETFERKFKDIFKLQDDLSVQIGSLILGELAPEQIDRITNNAKIDSRAYEAYLQGYHIHHLKYHKLGLQKDFLESEALFKKAIEIEPQYAMAYTGLADLYDTKKFISQDSTEEALYGVLRTEKLAKAKSLNPNLPYVHLTEGWSHFDPDKKYTDIDKAYNSFLKAYQLDIRNTDGLVGLYMLYQRFGLYDDCDRFLTKIEELNPGATNLIYQRIGFYLNFGQYGKVIEIANEGLAANPEDVALLRDLARAKFKTKKYAEVKDILDKLEKLNPAYYKRKDEMRHLHALVQDDLKKADEIMPESLYLSMYKQDAQGIKEKSYASLDLYKETENSFNIYQELMMKEFYNDFRNEAQFKKHLKYQKKKYLEAYHRFPRAQKILKP